MAAAAFVINNGKQLISARLIGSGTDPKFIQWGSGGSTAAVTDTGLQSTAGTTEARVAGTSTQQNGAQTLSKYQVTGSVVAAGTPTIQEVALFDTVGSGSPPSGGNCFVHASHGSTTLNPGESIAYTISVDFTP